MKVDLLRQLDAWGDRIEDSMEHVSAAEVMDLAEGTELAAKSARPEQPRQVASDPRWRKPLRYAGAIAVVIAMIVAIPNLFGREVSMEFSSLGGALGGDNPDRAQGFAAPSTTAAMSTTAAPDTTAAAGTFAPTVAGSVTDSSNFLNLGEAWALRQSGQPTDTTSAPTTTAVPSDTTIPPAGGNPASLGRAVIFVGDIAIETTDVSSAVAQARAIVEARGGYVFAQELGGQSTVVSLKVPAEFFQDTVDRVSELGTVRSARVTSQDVTERIVDLESQIVTSETSVTRLQQLLSEAETINTITKLEAELLDRETTLERLRGQLRTLQDQVALSTIVLTIREFVPQPSLNVVTTVRPTDGGTGDDCFTESFPRVPENEEYVMCVDLTNTGNLTLTDFDVRGPVALMADLRPVNGATVTELEPGERYTLWTTAVAVDDVREEITVRAIPLDQDGRALIEKTTQDSDQLRINVAFEPEPQPDPEPEDDGLPPLRDALSNGWNVLTTGLNALAVAGAFVLPFLWLPVLLLIGSWWWRRRQV